MDHRDPGVRTELLNEVVSDLAVSVHLVRMRADDHDLDLFVRSTRSRWRNRSTRKDRSATRRRNGSDCSDCSDRIHHGIGGRGYGALEH